MAFNKYLINLGNDSEKFAHFIIEQSYHVSKKIMDLGSYRDGNGELKRTVLDHVPYTISFTLRKVDNTNLQVFMNMIRKRFTVAKERKLPLTFYCPETDGYIQQDVYMPDPDFTIDHIDVTNNQIFFKETTIKFIGY